MDVIISGGAREFLRWGEQYARHSAARQNIVMGNGTSLNGAIRKIRQAATLVTANGKLIFSSGHGGAESVSVGMVDLAPRRRFRITSSILSNPRNASERRIKAAYDEVGEVIRESDVGEVIFLTCRVGNAMDFVQRIANDWNVEVSGYNQRVAGQIIPNPRGRGRISVVYLITEPPRGEREKIRASHELPRMSSLGNSFSASPGRRRRTVPRAPRRIR